MKVLPLKALDVSHPMLVCTHNSTKRKDIPININSPVTMEIGKNSSSGVFIPNILINNWAALFVYTFSGFHNTEIKGKTA